MADYLAGIGTDDKASGAAGNKGNTAGKRLIGEGEGW